MSNWNRKKTIEAINQAWGQVDISVAWTLPSPSEMIRIVEGWRRANGFPQELAVRVDDGFLFLNDEAVTRIAAKLPRVAYSAGAAYWEGRILARQEAF